jgi:hypothetical protein
MPLRVTAAPLFDDLLSTLTNQPASLDDEFGYGFEHARPPDSELSLLGVGRSITTGPDGSHYRADVELLASAAQTIPTTLIPLMVSLANGAPGSSATEIIRGQRRSG